MSTRIFFYELERLLQETKLEYTLDKYDSNENNGTMALLDFPKLSVTFQPEIEEALSAKQESFAQDRISKTWKLLRTPAVPRKFLVMNVFTNHEIHANVGWRTVIKLPINKYDHNGRGNFLK